MPPPPSSTLFPYTTLFRSADRIPDPDTEVGLGVTEHEELLTLPVGVADRHPPLVGLTSDLPGRPPRSEEHTSELRHVAISYAVFCLKKKNTSSRYASCSST